MSSDKKRDRALQRRVRERQEKTGETYQAAYQQIAKAPDLADPHTLARISTQLFDGALRAVDPRALQRRVPLPLSTRVGVLPGQSAQLTARPQLDAFWPERLLIKNADRWDVDHLTIGHWTSLKHLSLIKPKAREFALDSWHPLAAREAICGEDIVLVVTYTGHNEEGESFEAVLFGWEGVPPGKPTVRHKTDDSDRVSERAESKAIPNKTVTLPLIVKSQQLFVDRVTIADATNWIVNDLRVNKRSFFAQAGDVPGEMFTDTARVILEPLTKGDVVEILATYAGEDSSTLLAVDLSGTPKAPSGPREVSFFLPMSTNLPISPTQSAQITSRPQRPFLPERIVIADPDGWIVNDITVGVKSQFAQAGDLPGQAFASRTVGCHVTFDPVRVGKDFIMVTTRGDDCKTEANFVCGVQGRLV